MIDYISITTMSPTECFYKLNSSGGSRKKTFGGLAPHHLGGKNGWAKLL